jgi:DNA segregation ATPase FtsK/SpoIIIE-like protein
MTPTSILFIVISCLVVVAFLVSRVVEALFRIARRIEATNTHLDEINTELAQVAQALNTSVIGIHGRQNELEGKVDDLENTANPTYDEDDLDPFYEQAVKIVTESGSASASLLQRRLDIGYARAARIIDVLETRGVVGAAEGSKPRQVFASPTEAEPLFEDAVSLGQKEGKISPAMLQRNLQIGYARAARMIDLLETEGYVGRADGAKPRPMLK